jgi:predicted transcriptional regulator
MADDFSFETDDEKALLRELQLLKCLTSKRIEIMKTIAKYHPQSIRDLSRILERNIKNVFEDLILLQENKFIGFEDEGKNKKPIMIMKKVTFYYKKGEKNEKKTLKVN